MSWRSASRFYRQLGLVHRSGIALTQAVEMAGSIGGAEHALHAPAWSRGCSAGGSLADQLASTREPPIAVALMRAGERSGRLPDLAGLLADHYDHLIALRSLVIARLFYPVLLMHAALIIPAVPAVVLGTASPWRLLVGPVILWGIVLAIGITARVLDRSGGISRLALLGPARLLTMPFIEANAYRVLNAALAAGMLVPESLELAAGACGNARVCSQLRDAGSAVRQGTIPNLAAALRSCGFSDTTVGLIANGEIAGKTEETLTQAAVIDEEAFRVRTMYTAKLFCGTVYGIAVLLAVLQVFSMYNQVMIQPLQDEMRQQAADQ